MTKETTPMGDRAVLLDLARVKALFQARAIAAVIGAPAPFTLSHELADLPVRDGVGA